MIGAWASALLATRSEGCTTKILLLFLGHIATLGRTNWSTELGRVACGLCFPNNCFKQIIAALAFEPGDEAVHQLPWIAAASETRLCFLYFGLEFYVCLI